MPEHDGRAQASFDPSLPWRLHPKVALRDEEFGALAYHYDNRRLVFLKSRELVDLVRSLESHEDATSAIIDSVGPDSFDRYQHALERLAASEVIGVR